jgi:hypothetical protein
VFIDKIVEVIMYNNYNEVSEASFNIGRNFIEIKTEYDCDSYSPHLSSNASVLKLLQDQNEASFVG